MRRFRTVATILGSPVYWGPPYQDHTPEQLAVLRGLGVDTLVANLAWSRPWMDVVNLEDLHVSPSYPWLSDARRAAELRVQMRQRVDAAVAAGLRPFFLFGCPRQLDLTALTEEERRATEPLIGVPGSRIAGGVVLACIRSEGVRRLYRELIAEHFRTFPETAGLLVYTVDELAEVCDERDPCPRCQGVPLPNRLPEFLECLADAVRAANPRAELWWEPWEFSATQTLEVVERLSPGVRVAAHKCIHEVYYAGGPDAWLRQLCRVAERRGIEVVVEAFFSGTGEDLGPLPAYPCPRLVLEQVQEIARLPAVTGVKEYFGTVAEHVSVNEQAWRLALATPERPVREALGELAEQYPDADPERLLSAWESAAQALEEFPWDLSWRLRQYNSVRYDQQSPGEYWSAHFRRSLPTPWTTPSWESSRLGFYAVAVSETAATEWMLEETARRLERCLERVDEAREGLEGAGPGRAELQLQARSVRVFGLLARSRLLHLRASRRADQLRARLTPDAAEGLAATLAEDLANARELRAHAAQFPHGFDLAAFDGTLAAMERGLAGFAEAPREWVEQHFV